MIKNGSLEKVINGWYTNDEDYQQTPNESLFRSAGVLYSYGYHFPLALHLGRYQLINADRYSKSTDKHQSYTISRCGNPVEIPFSALAEMINSYRKVPVNLRLRDDYGFNPNELMDNMEILDTMNDVWTEKGRNIKGEIIWEHTLGATLFTYTFNNFTHYILSGIDDTGKGIHVYFMTELVGTPQTVDEAFECMKPEEVKIAEAKGLDVRRQGEWFFVKSDWDYDGKGEKDYMLKDPDGDKGHHKVSEGLLMADGSQQVRGIVKHINGDHKQVKLYDDVKHKEWYLAYHNLQIKSFTATGAVD